MVRSLLVSSFFAMLASPAFAGTTTFSCTSVDQDTQIDVTFETHEETEASSVHRMVLLDPNVRQERQHIATFYAADGVLKAAGSTIVATVDLTKPESSRAGERVGGTRLGALDSIVLEIDFSYTENLNHERKFSGLVTYRKKNGDELMQDFDCSNKGSTHLVLQ